MVKIFFLINGIYKNIFLDAIAILISNILITFYRDLKIFIE